MRLHDDGVVANVPMRQAVEMGARSLIVLDCALPGHLPDAPESLAEVLLFTMTVTMRSQAVVEAPMIAADLPAVFLPGPAWRRVSPLDFHHTDALIEGAYEAARTFLADVDPDRPRALRLPVDGAADVMSATAWFPGGVGTGESQAARAGR